MEEISERVTEVLERLESAGREAETLGTPRELAEQMVASIPRTSAHNLQLGPYYTTTGLSKWLNVSRQYVLEVTKQRRFIAMTTADGHRVYPSFQFGPKGAPIRDLPKILAILDRGLSPATSAMWLQTPQEALDGLTPAAWMLDWRDPEAVFRLAEQYMVQFEGAPES